MNENTETENAENMPETESTENENALDNDTENTEPGNPNREAAKYRTRLREVEADLEQARTELTAARRQLIAAAMPHGTSVDLIDSMNIDYETLLDETGAVDAAKLREALAPVRDAIELQRGAYVPSIGDTPESDASHHWAGAFRPPSD